MVFSLSMLFYMVGASHFFGPLYDGQDAGKAWTFVIISLVIGAILELNCLGKLGGTATTNKLLWPYENHKNAMYASVALWVVLYILGEIFLKA
jgi:carbon starvation protein CstA